MKRTTAFVFLLGAAVVSGVERKDQNFWDPVDTGEVVQDDFLNKFTHQTTSDDYSYTDNNGVQWTYTESTNLWHGVDAENNRWNIFDDSGEQEFWNSKNDYWHKLPDGSEVYIDGETTSKTITSANYDQTHWDCSKPVSHQDDTHYSAECDFYFYAVDGDQHYIAAAGETLEWTWDSANNIFSFFDYQTRTGDANDRYVVTFASYRRGANALNCGSV